MTSEMSSQLAITNMTKNGIVVTRIDNVTEVSGNPALLIPFKAGIVVAAPHIPQHMLLNLTYYTLQE
jgi:hypothetical protein